MIRSARWPLMAGFTTLAVLVFGLGGWAALSSISGAVVSSGRVEVQNQRQILQHPDGGVVAALFVQEGAPVVAGQVLMALDGTALRSERAMADAQYFEVLARSGRLEAERDGAGEIAFGAELRARAAQDAAVAELMRGQEALFAVRARTLSGQREQLAERITQIESQLGGHAAQIAALERQAGLIGQELADKRSLLERGLMQASTVMALDREKARLEGERGALMAQVGEARGRIVETRLEVLNLDAQRREDATNELRDLGVQALQLAEKRQALSEKIARLEIRAPVGGVLYGLAVSGPHAVLRAAETVGYVVPQDRPLVIAARISPNEIDSVHPGQEAKLRFTAFSSRTTPELRGRVTLVSADAFEDKASGQSYFRAEVALDPAERARLGAAQVLPGMPVEVMLATGSRSALSYLMKPVTDYFARAFRET